VGKHARGEGCGHRPNKAGEGAQEVGRGPDGSVGAYVRDPLKVAGPGRPLGWAAEDGVLEGFWGLLAAGTRGRGSVVPGRVGAEGALPRSHLVQATCVKLG